MEGVVGWCVATSDNERCLRESCQTEKARRGRRKEGEEENRKKGEEAEEEEGGRGGEGGDSPSAIWVGMGHPVMARQLTQNLEGG